MPLEAMTIDRCQAAGALEIIQAVARAERWESGGRLGIGTKSQNA